MNMRLLWMLNSAVEVLGTDLLKVTEWTSLETRASKLGECPLSQEEQNSLADLQIERASLLSGLDEAIDIYVQARNAFAESDELNVSEMTVNWEDETYQDQAEQREKEAAA